MEGVAGIVAPADGSSWERASGPLPPQTFRWNMPPSVGREKGGEVPQLHRPLFSINLVA